MITVENVHNYIRVIGEFEYEAKMFYIPKNTGRFDIVSNENFEIYSGDYEDRQHLGNYENISIITRDLIGTAIETPFSSFFEANEWFSTYLSGTSIISTVPSTLYAEQAISMFLSDTDGSENMNIDGSVISVDFYLEAIYLSFLERSFIGLKDGTQDFISSNFGAISGGLINGVDIIILSNGIEIPITNWKTNYDISLTMYDFYSPYKDGAYVGRWTFSKDNGKPYAIRPSDRFIIRIQDDLTGLDYFKFRVKGYL